MKSKQELKEENCMMELSKSKHGNKDIKLLKGNVYIG